MKGRIVMKITNKKIGRLIAGLMICSSLLATPLSVFAEGTDSSKEEKTETLSSSETPATYGREMTSEEKAEALKKTEESSTQQKQIEQEIKAETPASVTGQKVEGTGTVTDFVTSGSKAFYTITDSD